MEGESRCPRCGIPKNPDDTECPKCGIVFKKWEMIQWRNETRERISEALDEDIALLKKETEAEAEAMAAEAEAMAEAIAEATAKKEKKNKESQRRRQEILGPLYSFLFTLSIPALIISVIILIFDFGMTPTLAALPVAVVSVFMLFLIPTTNDDDYVPSDDCIYFLNGNFDLLEVFEDRIEIKQKGMFSLLHKGIKGTKAIPIISISAIQLKECGSVFSGYIQFTIPGGNESRGGVNSAVKDENTVMFRGIENNKKAKQIKAYLHAAIQKSGMPQSSMPSASLSDEILKLSQLREQGVLSDDEFQAAKNKLIR